MKDQNIHDNFLMVQQLAKYLHRQREPHVLLKLDISKAFDSVSWSFLLEVLQQLGFGRKWCNLISLLLSTSSQALLNGEPGEQIYHHWGPSTRGPIIPYAVHFGDARAELLGHESNTRWPPPTYCSPASLPPYLRPVINDLAIIKQLRIFLGTPLDSTSTLQRAQLLPFGAVMRIL